MGSIATENNLYAVEHLTRKNNQFIKTNEHKNRKEDKWNFLIFHRQTVFTFYDGRTNDPEMI